MSAKLKSGYKQTEVGVIPENWEMKRLGELFEITSSKRVFQSEWKSEGIPFYRARELAILGEKGFINNELFISKEMYDAYKKNYGVPKIGDMLVTGVGTLGKVFVVSDDHEFYFKDGNIIWFKILGKVRSDFLRQLYLTQSIIKQIDDASAGTTVGTYTISSAKKTIIPFPPLAEQEAIAESLSDADALIESLEQLIAKKRLIKQGAMQELLTGKKRLPGFNGEWGVKALGEIGEALIGLTYKPSDVRSDGVLVLRSSNVHEGELRFEDNVFVAMDVPDRIMIRTSDILICVRNGSRDLIGKCAKIDGRAQEMTFGAFMAVFRTPFHKFVYHQFQSNVIKRQIHEHLGATINQITNKSLNSFQIPFPMDEAEQTAIATTLSNMDAEIAALETKLVKTLQIKQGMMQELLTGRIRLI